MVLSCNMLEYHNKSQVYRPQSVYLPDMKYQTLQYDKMLFFWKGSELYLSVILTAPYLTYQCVSASVSLSCLSSLQGVSSLAGGAAIPTLGAQREACQRGRRGTASHTHL